MSDRGFLIRGGNVYDPETGTWSVRDLAVQGGVIVTDLTTDNVLPIDASGCMVTTGWIDSHVHYYAHSNEPGISPDAVSFPSGITTVVDAGSSGAATYEMYRKGVMQYSDVRILNMLYMASGGIITKQHVTPGEINKDAIRSLFRQYPDNLTGLKLMLQKGIVAAEDAEEVVRRTVALAEEIGAEGIPCNVTVHITDPVMDLELLASLLRPGDVICHIYQGKGDQTCLDAEGRVRAGILAARARGVIFDSCNGCNNFDLEVARQAIAQGFKPDVISSDMNTSGSFMQPLHSLPRIMSKYLMLGMALEEILTAVTRTPAMLLHRDDLASLAPGTAADLIIFRVIDKDLPYYDRGRHPVTLDGRNALIGHKAIVPQLTMRDGVVVFCQSDFA